MDCARGVVLALSFAAGIGAACGDAVPSDSTEAPGGQADAGEDALADASGAADVAWSPRERIPESREPIPEITPGVLADGHSCGTFDQVLAAIPPVDQGEVVPRCDLPFELEPEECVNVWFDPETCGASVREMIRWVGEVEVYWARLGVDGVELEARKTSLDAEGRPAARANWYAGRQTLLDRWRYDEFGNVAVHEHETASGVGEYSERWVSIGPGRPVERVYYGTNRDGVVERWTWDGERLVAHFEGERSVEWFDGEGRVASVRKGPLLTKFEYGPWGPVASLTRRETAEGARDEADASWEYDDRGRLLRHSVRWLERGFIDWELREAVLYEATYAGERLVSECVLGEEYLDDGQCTRWRYDDAGRLEREETEYWFMYSWGTRLNRWRFDDAGVPLSLYEYRYETDDTCDASDTWTYERYATMGSGVTCVRTTSGASDLSEGYECDPRGESVDVDSGPASLHVEVEGEGWTATLKNRRVDGAWRSVALRVSRADGTFDSYAWGADGALRNATLGVAVGATGAPYQLRYGPQWSGQRTTLEMWVGDCDRYVREF